MSSNTFGNSVLSGISGSMPQNTFYVPTNAETTTSSSNSMEDFMSAVMSSMSSATSGVSTNMPSQMDVNTLAQAISGSSGKVNLNLPLGQQAKGEYSNKYRTVSRSNYGQMWG